MTQTLTLQMERPGWMQRDGIHGTVITVRQVADLDGRYPDLPFETAVVAEAEAVSINVQSGRYRLEARLPGGQVLRENRVVGRNSTEVVTFSVPQSAHEWLAWQTASGNVPPRELYEEQRDNSGLDWLGNGFRGLNPDHFAGTYSPPREPLLMYAHCRMDRPFRIGYLDTRVGTEDDGLVHLWRMSVSESAFWNHPRAVAMIEREGPGWDKPVRQLALLPLPWKNSWGEASELQLLFDGARQDGRQLRVSVVDSKRSALLGYLGASQMREAAVAFDAYRFSEQILDDIESKRQNPLAAAAAAYVGLGFPVGDERREPWAPWLRNLMNWFPDIPDGAILLARDILDRAQTQDDLRDALHMFMVACDRGIPYFSVGVRLLLEGLTLFLRHARTYDVDRNLLRRVHRDVSRVALMTDPTQAFTVLTLERGYFHV